MTSARTGWLLLRETGRCASGRTSADSVQPDAYYIPLLFFALRAISTPQMKDELTEFYTYSPLPHYPRHARPMAARAVPSLVEFLK